MGIKEKLLGKKDISMEEEETPTDFVENKKVIAESEDVDIAEFIRKKKVQREEKEAKKYGREEPEEEPEPEQVKDISPVTEEPMEPEKISFTQKVHTIYMTKNLVDETKKKIFQYTTEDYGIGMQAGIVVTKDNVEKVSSILKYLAENDFLVVFTAQKAVEIFNEHSK